MEDFAEKTRGSDGRVGKGGVMKHAMGTGYEHPAPAPR